MQYRRMRGVETPLSVLGFGAMRLPKTPDGRIDREAGDGDGPARDRRRRQLRRYGLRLPRGRERAVPGRGARRTGTASGSRLATKLPVWLVKSRATMDRYLDEQLARLRTDDIDFYLLHGLNREGWERLQGLGVLEFLDDALADGRIRHAGFSFHDDVAAFTPIVDAYDWDFCQIQYNYMDVDYQAGSEASGYAAERRLGVVVMEPLRGGALARPIPGAAELWATAGPSGRRPSGRCVALGPARGHGRALGHERHGPGRREPRVGGPGPPGLALAGRARRLRRRPGAVPGPGRDRLHPVRVLPALPVRGRHPRVLLPLQRGVRLRRRGRRRSRATTSSPGSAGPPRTAPTAASARSAARRGCEIRKYLKAVTGSWADGPAAVPGTVPRVRAQSSVPGESPGGGANLSPPQQTTLVPAGTGSSIT